MISISSAFDGGNIRLVAAEGDRVDLEIVKDHQSDFYQWFYFRVTGAKGRPLELRILNCAGSAYPHGWDGYRACISYDRDEWVRADTAYAGGTLTISVTPEADSLWVAYFAPYSMEMHHDLVAEVAGQPGVAYRSLGKTLDGTWIICASARGRCRSGSMPASIPARRWRNGGWKARSGASSTRRTRWRGCCGGAAPSMSCRT
jgi:murein tripeptide amidase MpaA